MQEGFDQSSCGCSCSPGCHHPGHQVKTKIGLLVNKAGSLRLAGVEPWKVVAGTAGVSLALAYLYSLTQVCNIFTSFCVSPETHRVASR